MKNTLLLFILLAMISCQHKEEDTNSRYNIEEEEAIASLLREMTLEEKVGQMTQVTIDMILKDGTTTEVDEQKLKTALIDKHIGSIINVKGHAYSMETWHKIITQIQDVALNNTARKIPVLYGIDAIHGTNYIAGSTLYPHNIGMAATRNPELVKKAAQQTAIATRASGIRWNFDPVLGLGRVPLWSRFEETFGEDVILATEMGIAAIQGYEGESLKSPMSVASCMKHYLGYSLPASGKDRTPAYIPEYILREYLLPPFEAAVKANSATIMINSGEINGIPVHGSKYFLTDILRKELGFEGLAVSDWEDVKRLHDRHKVAATPKLAVKMAVEAGLDMSMVPLDYSFYDLLLELVKEGEIYESRLDQSVRRILKLKYQLGLFDNAYPEEEALQAINKEETNNVALQAARQTMTLLKNDDKTLPFETGKKVYLAGPAANNLTSLHSSWSYTWQGNDADYYPETTKTIFEQFQEIYGADQVSCNSLADFSAPENYDVAQFQRAEVAAADYIVLCLGEKAYAESPGSIDDLTLPEAQLVLAKAAIATGKPVVLVLTEGRPRIIAEIEKDIPAILMAYRPSTMGAQAIVEVITGAYNPSGRLPFSYPKATGDLVKYDHKFTEGIREDVPNQYTAETYRPQWPFGHGLSYTSFEYTDLKVDKTDFNEYEEVLVSINVKNIGDISGDDIVELYISDSYASITPSVKRLKKFTRLSLEAGENQMVNFKLKASDLSFININNQRVTEPGEFILMVGDQKVAINYQPSNEKIN